MDSVEAAGPTGFIQVSDPSSIRQMVEAFLDIVVGATNERQVEPIGLGAGVDLADLDALEAALKERLDQFETQCSHAGAFPDAWVARNEAGAVVLRWEGQWTPGRCVEVDIYSEHAIFAWDSFTGRVSQFIDIAGRLQGVVIDQMMTSEEPSPVVFKADEITQDGDVEVVVFRRSDEDDGEDAEA